MRNEKTIELEDRGNKLVFKVKEMSATQLEDWTMRACLVLAGAGSKIPAGGGVEGIGKYIAEHGLACLGEVDYARAKPLLDEMLGCCSRVVDKVEERVTPETADAYIEDMATLFKLRTEALKLNFSFFGSGTPSDSPEKGSTVRLSAR